MSFRAFQVSFEKKFFTFAEETDKLFWRIKKEKTFAFVGKRLEHLESTETEYSFSKSFDCSSWSIIKKFEGMEPVFVK